MSGAVEEVKLEAEALHAGPLLWAKPGFKPDP